MGRNKLAVPEWVLEKYTEEEFNALSCYTRSKIRREGPNKVDHRWGNTKRRKPMPEYLITKYSEEEYFTLDSHKRWALRNPKIDKERERNRGAKYRDVHPEYESERKRKKAIKDIETFAYNKWATYIKVQYKISTEQYWKLFDEQKGLCAICGEPETVIRKLKIYDVPYTSCRLCVDHDHSCCPGPRSCGKCVRGLLCNACNSMLGLTRDSIHRMEQGIIYLKNYKKTKGDDSVVTGPTSTVPCQL